MYNHWTQSLPKAIRKQLTINGEPVAEPDYLAHHLCILYALEGLRPPGNPYEIEGWDRDIVKRAVLIAINAKNLASTIGAIIYWYDIIRDKAARLVEAIKRKHKMIEKYFHSGAGLWLQRIDSDMAERVVLEQSRQGNPVLPVHDRFIAPARLEGAVREQMDEAFETIISRERGASRKSLPAQRLNPESSYTMVDPSPSFVPFPVHFLRSSSALAVSAFFDDRRRITKSGLVAVLDAKRRRGLRQEELANLAAISRPALANILAGRFGASPQTAERISEIIALTPAFERQPFLPGLAA